MSDYYEDPMVEKPKDIATPTRASRVQDAIDFLRDDAAAISYQTMGQYRTAVLRILGGVENGGETCDMPNGPCACGAWHGKIDIAAEAARMGVKPHDPIVGLVGG